MKKFNTFYISPKFIYIFTTCHWSMSWGRQVQYNSFSHCAAPCITLVTLPSEWAGGRCTQCLCYSCAGTKGGKWRRVGEICSLGCWCKAQSSVSEGDTAQPCGRGERAGQLYAHRQLQTQQMSWYLAGLGSLTCYLILYSSAVSICTTCRHIKGHLHLIILSVDVFSVIW